MLWICFWLRFPLEALCRKSASFGKYFGATGGMDIRLWGHAHVESAFGAPEEWSLGFEGEKDSELV